MAYMVEARRPTSFLYQFFGLFDTCSLTLAHYGSVLQSQALWYFFTSSGSKSLKAAVVCIAHTCTMERPGHRYLQCPCIRFFGDVRDMTG